MCNFPTIKDAADVAIATMLSGIQVESCYDLSPNSMDTSVNVVTVRTYAQFTKQVSRVELLDEVQVKAINLANGKNLPEVPTLMFEFIGTGINPLLSSNIEGISSNQKLNWISSSIDSYPDEMTVDLLLLIIVRTQVRHFLGRIVKALSL